METLSTVADGGAQGRDISCLVRASHARMRGVSVEPNGDGGLVEELNLGWARHFGIVDGAKGLQKLARIGCGSFAAYTYPRASPTVLGIGANLISWLYLFDDRFGEGSEPSQMRALFSGLDELVRAGHVPSHATPFHRALKDLRERCLALGGHGWLQRFADSLYRYYEGCLYEIPYRKRAEAPTLAEYREIRSLSVGAYPVFDVIELDMGEVLSASLAKQPELLELRQLGAMLCAWVNDIFSFEKELTSGDPLNLVAVLLHEGDRSIEEAFNEAVSVYNDDVARFEALSSQIAQAGGPSSVERLYVQGLNDWVHGNRAWTETSGRYKKVSAA